MQAEQQKAEQVVEQQSGQSFRGVPERLRHDTNCICHASGIYARSCSCGEYVRDPGLWQTINPKAYVATLEAIGERRPFTGYIAQFPTRTGMFGTGKAA
jgi:hypothetical protein